MNTFLISLITLVAAQSDQTSLRGEQYSALRSLMTGLGCNARRCPDFEFSAPCPLLVGNGAVDSLVCTNGSVVRLSLSHGLTGSVDGPSLRRLTDLTFLTLEGHTLTTIPTQIGLLIALTSLTLALSAMWGTVPSQVASLTNLLSLAIHQNKLTGTLPALEKLTKLTALYTLDNFGLGGTMPALPTTIRLVQAQNCAFTALPPNLSALTVLNFVHLHANKFVGPPFEPPSWVTNCILQQSGAETNCFNCPAIMRVRQCVCVQNNSTACPGTTPTTKAITAPTTTSLAMTVVTASPATSISTNSTSVTTLLVTTTSATPSALEPWIIGVVIGVGMLVAVIIMGVFSFFFLKLWRQQQKAADDAELSHPHSKDEALPPNYVELPSNPFSRYAANASEFKSEIPQESNYGLIHDADHYAKGAAEFTAGVAQEPTYSKIDE
jgi:hypothetical protein